MVAVSLVYVLVNWPYTPADALQDSKKLGMWGFLIDILIILPIILFIANRKKTNRERLKYQRNESEIVGEV
jgi:hypothetical protein